VLVSSPRSNAEKVSLHTNNSLTLTFTFIALKTLANSEFHYQKAQEIPMPDKVDLFGFMKLCDDALGIKP
jgi:hypothetical protein